MSISVSRQGAMRHFLRQAVLAFLVLWLPLQAFAASGMAFCPHSQQKPAPEAHAMHAAHSCHDSHHDQGQPAKNTSCDDCMLCHLCSVSAVPTVAAAPSLIAAAVPYPQPINPTTTFVPEQPQRPPLRLA